MRLAGKVIAKSIRILVVVAVTICQTTIYSHAQDNQGQPFTGKDQWKNRYIKRSQEISALKEETAKRRSALEMKMTEREKSLFVERPLFDEDVPPSGKKTPEEELLGKYVKNEVTVLDPKSVSDIFGRRIARRYVAFQVTISNESKDYQFLIHDVSIDLAEAADLESVVIPNNYEPSSNDITLLRGVSEKGQIYDWRNLATRLLRGTGSIAAALLGVTTFGSSYAPSVAVYNGPFASAFRDVLPDMTVNQLNRLNDSAYQANTLVPKQGSKVIVAFLDQALLMDHELRKRFNKDPLSIADIIDFRRARAKVSGMLITDVLDQPPMITAIVIKEEQIKHFLDKPATVEGTVIGKNFTGAEIQLENAPTGVEVKVKGVPESNRLDFVLTSKEPVLVESLNFLVVGKNDVSKYNFPVPSRIETPVLLSLTPASVKQGEENVTITASGSGFIKSLFSVTGCEKIKIKDPVWESSSEIKFNVHVPADAQIGICEVRINNGSNFVSGPQPLTIEKASDR